MRGGKRAGAGRKSQYNAPTKVIRVPENILDKVKNLMENKSGVSFPFFECTVSAGFPSPADDHIDKSLDLNSHLVHNPASTFFVRASGDSMLNAGIFDGDLLIVDRSIKPENGKIVIAALNGDLTVKRLVYKTGKIFLAPENPRYRTIELTSEIETVIWGVVTNVVHKL